MYFVRYKLCKTFVGRYQKFKSTFLSTSNFQLHLLNCDNFFEINLYYCIFILVICLLSLFVLRSLMQVAPANLLGSIFCIDALLSPKQSQLRLIFQIKVLIRYALWGHCALLGVSQSMLKISKENVIRASTCMPLYSFQQSIHYALSPDRPVLLCFLKLNFMV